MMKKISIYAALFGALLAMPLAAKADQSNDSKDQKAAIDKQIDQLSKKVDLKSQQKDQIRTALTSHQQEIKQAWQKFDQANAKVIALEAEFVAAVQDSMDESQKQNFQANRQQKKSANHSSSSSQSSQSTNTSTSQSTIQQQSNSGSTNTYGNQQTTAKSSNQRGQQQGQQGSKNRNSQTEDYVWEMVIIPVQESASSTGLSADQQRQCDASCRAYHQSLTQAYQDVAKYHDKLVNLEAKQMRSAENVLTDAQRAKLKKSRQQPSLASNQSDKKS